MKKHNILGTVIVLLVVSNFLSISLFLVHIKKSNYFWKIEMNGIASYAGTLQAVNDYKKGNFRLYKLLEGDQKQFLEKGEGNLEVWSWPYHKELGWRDKYTQDRFVEAYNRKMANMLETSEKNPQSN